MSVAKYPPKTSFESLKGHPAKRWENPGMCPKCGNIMLKGEETMLWD
jgi:hypothetical protein